MAVYVVLIKDRAKLELEADRAASETAGVTLKDSENRPIAHFPRATLDGWFERSAQEAVKR